MLIENGILKPLVAMALPLEQAAQADRLIEAEHVQGRIVLTI
jgi:NADPH:quinone reductase-like Zn-dependent oxidoreductase